MDDTPTNILADYIRRDRFACEHNISLRTVDRYRNERNGLPWLIFGGYVYIHRPGAAAWLERRLRRANPRQLKRIT
jgi:hypothetical protein